MIQNLIVYAFGLSVAFLSLYGLFNFIMQKTNLKHDIITPKGVRHE